MEYKIYTAAALTILGYNAQVWGYKRNKAANRFFRFYQKTRENAIVDGLDN